MEIRVTIPPAGVIALRALSAKWRHATQIRLHPLIAGVEPGNDPDADGFEKLGLSEQAIFKHCADDLDALVARVEPQEVAHESRSPDGDGHRKCENDSRQDECSALTAEGHIAGFESRPTLTNNQNYAPPPQEQRLDLEPYKRRIEQLRADGEAHVASWKESYGHADGPDMECGACDDIFGEANALTELVAEVERLAAPPAPPTQEPTSPTDPARDP